MPDATCLGKNRFLVASERLYDEGVNESKAGKKCILHAVLGLSMSADEVNGINCFPVLPLGGVAAEGRRAAMPHHGTWHEHHAISQLDGPLAKIGVFVPTPVKILVHKVQPFEDLSPRHKPGARNVIHVYDLVVLAAIDFSRPLLGSHVFHIGDAPARALKSAGSVIYVCLRAQHSDARVRFSHRNQLLNQKSVNACVIVERKYGVVATANGFTKAIVPAPCHAAVLRHFQNKGVRKARTQIGRRSVGGGIVNEDDVLPGVGRLHDASQTAFGHLLAVIVENHNPNSGQPLVLPAYLIGVIGVHRSQMLKLQSDASGYPACRNIWDNSRIGRAKSLPASSLETSYILRYSKSRRTNCRLDCRRCEDSEPFGPPSGLYDNRDARGHRTSRSFSSMENRTAARGVSQTARL